jgi:hypothetical protein
MTHDLIERLKARLREPHRLEPDPDCAAAAVEIERLRARIAELEVALHRIVDAPNLDVMTAWAIAHGALGDGA